MKVVRLADMDDSFFAYHQADCVEQVRTILRAVRKRGDMALKDFTSKFDGVDIHTLLVPEREIAAAFAVVDIPLQQALKQIAANLRNFACKQKEFFQDFEYQSQPGVWLGQRTIPIERVGIYVPGGRFPLISSLLMGIVPAQVAGVKDLVICSPPSSNGSIHPAILVAASQLGIDEIYRVGGAQAIGALAYGGGCSFGSACRAHGKKNARERHENRGSGGNNPAWPAYTGQSIAIGAAFFI